jgi:hypothetical protein
VGAMVVEVVEVVVAATTGSGLSRATTIPIVAMTTAAHARSGANDANRGGLLGFTGSITASMEPHEPPFG